MESLYRLFIIFTCMVVNVFVNKTDFLKGSHGRDLKNITPTYNKKKTIIIDMTKKLGFFSAMYFCHFVLAASNLNVIASYNLNAAKKKSAPTWNIGLVGTF